jgi:NAD(P)-dependent dehydrogenase (short-subunit alcohol dehydrogenase family)
MRRLYDINVHGSFFTAREAAQIMAANSGGSIVLIASMSAHIINFPQVCSLSKLSILLTALQPQTPYNASKAGTGYPRFLSVLSRMPQL